MNALLRRASWRHHAGRPGLLALSVLGVAVGVAVVVGIDTANSSARRAFEQSAAVVGGSATHVISGSGGDLADSVYTNLRVRAGLRTVAPLVTGSVRTAGTRTTLTILGIDPLVDVSVRSMSSSSGFPDPSRLLTEAGTMVLSRETAAALGKVVGDTLLVDADGRRSVLRLAGTVQPADPVALQGWKDLAVMDIASAQDLFRMKGRLSQIDVVDLADGELAELGAGLPAGVLLMESENRGETLAQMTRAFETNLTALSYLALLVGLFLVYNIVSFSVARRQIILGRLRAIGVPRRTIEHMVLMEALAIGLVGTVIGLALGVLLGSGLVRLVTRAINDLYFVVSVRSLDLGWVTWSKGLVLGLGATALAAWGPARRAGRIPASASLRRSDEEERLRRRFGPLLAGAVALGALGSGLLLYDTGVVGAYAGLLAIVAAFALTAPPTAHGLSRVLASLGRGTLWRMATGGIRARLSRTSVAIAALALAVAAALGVGIMVDGFRGTVETWLGYALEADLYARSPGTVARRGGGPLDREIVARFRADPDVREAFGVRQVPARTDVGVVDLVAIEHGPATHGTYRFRELGVDDPWIAIDSGDYIAVSEPFAFRKDVGVGDSITIETARGRRSMRIAAVYYDYGSDLGAVMLGRPAYERLFDDDRFAGLALFLREGADREAVARRLRDLASGSQRVVVQSNAALRQASLDVFDRTFAVTMVLRLLAIIVAFVGIVSALGAMQLDRAWEFGVLRAVGLTPKRLGRLIVLESSLMGLIAGVLALPLGLILAYALVHVINRRSFGWTLQFEISPELMAQALLVAVGAGIAAALIPAFRATRAKAAVLLRGGALVLLVTLGLGCSSAPAPAESGIGAALRTDTTGYSRALNPRIFVFPEDHGPHPDYRIEWWYFTGHLETPSARRFGYQFTIFRTALSPPGAEEPRSSDWATRQLYSAHLALSDQAGGGFQFAERFARGAAGLAGASGDPFRVWVEDWQTTGSGDLDSVRIAARDPDFGIDLLLSASKPIVLQGDQGLSAKGPEPGQASYYYSVSRLASEGLVITGGDSLRVSGTSWLDREWSTSLLSEDQTGWDWFSIQLDTGHDLMYFQLRAQEEGAVSFVDGALVDPAGVRLPLDPATLSVRVTDTWRSPRTGATYPSGWVINGADPAVSLVITPVLRDQELDVSVRYWEGAVDVTGEYAGRSVAGRGFVELTGY